MIQDLDKIKRLLATTKQTEETLGEIDKNGECTYCIEGIFGLTSNLVESVDMSSGEIYFYNDATNENYDSQLDYVDFPDGIPEVVEYTLLLDNKE